MSASFFRSTRLLETDTLHSSKMTLLLATVLLGAWFGWFFFTHVAIYAISDTADLEVDRATHPVEAQFTGRIVNSHLVLDKQVKADEVLVELDAKPQKLQLNEQQAQLAAVDPQSRSIETEITSEENAWHGEQQSAIEALEEARAHYREGEAAARFAQHEAERLRKMYTAGIVPELDYNRALADAQQRQAAADSLRFAISRLEREQRTREGESPCPYSATSHPSEYGLGLSAVGLRPHNPDGRRFFRDPATHGVKHLEGHCERVRACGRTCRRAGIIRVARSLAAVGVESWPAADELWARSRQVARALMNPE